ncbi:MAG: hypothetical protein JW846_06275 [Dehalococcoidia bacterium]|nr:hypothetical protein [Dehalococcoidia bacterium]
MDILEPDSNPADSSSRCTVQEIALKFVVRQPFDQILGGVKMRKVLPLVCALPVLAGCSIASPPSNQPPKAYIDVISPVELNEGETVTFIGQGTDADGEVVAFLWRSDRDGELSRSTACEINSLSVGDHAITFAVQDNSDTWSAEARATVKVLPAAAIMAMVTEFRASPSTVEPGETAILSWNVTGATSVSIDHGIGTVPASGSVVVTPDATVTYNLVATCGGSPVTSHVDVTVQRAVNSLTLSADEGMSGYIRSSGVERTTGMYVGDDNANRDIQGFLTYRISDIPDDAVITRVIFDLSGYNLPYDAPFPGLGCLRAYEEKYSAIRDHYFVGEPTNPICEWCNSDDLNTPRNCVGMRAALQEKVGENKFQIRLQFRDPRSDFDDVRDLLHWDRGSLPTMTVEYFT